MSSESFKEAATSETQSSPPEKIQLKRKGDFGETNAKKFGRKEIRGGIEDWCLAETEYYFENFLRKVYPYYFTYTTFCKRRWVGKPLIDVFCEEFHAQYKVEYEKKIITGKILVNGIKISADYVFKANDVVTNRVHRHETAVAAAPIKVIHSDHDFLVVDKPPSVPIQPCGGYRHNCVLYILAKEHNLKVLYTVHRLDRLISGLLLFTKTNKKLKEVNKQIEERKVKKEYVCRVDGEFPDGVVHCKEPIEYITSKMGICLVSPTGKECETIFEKMSYNGKSSVVKCNPLTERRHQIRVHLQYLGYPIMNDPLYNHEHVFGPLKGKNGEIGKTRDQLLEDLSQTRNLKWLIDDDIKNDETNVDEANQVDDSEENRMSLSALDYYLKSDGFKKLAKSYVKKPEKLLIDSSCDLCHQKSMDPQPKDLVLFLHALKYRGEDWEFESELPGWAKDDWNENVA